MMAAKDASDRLQAELALILAMYSENVTFSSKAREFKFVHIHNTGTTKDQATATLELRIPDLYPKEGFPEVLAATGLCNEDLRSSTQAAFKELASPPGEEVLDALLLTFSDSVESRKASQESSENSHALEVDKSGRGQHKTVIIWLHHLLNTNKRKFALNPSLPNSGINDITKPGYPGVLAFSGPEPMVDAHVGELRSQRWQAFQVRHDSQDEAKVDESHEGWNFERGEGNLEVESMSQVVGGILDASHKETFLSAMGVK